MKIYDEITREEILDPDLSAGYVYDGFIVTGHTEDRIEVMEGTVTEDRPDGLRRLIPAQDITEPCQWYHAYTEEELAQQKPSSKWKIVSGGTYKFENGKTYVFGYGFTQNGDGYGVAVGKLI